MTEPVRVLFVCLGNICRSPTAHGVFESMVQARGLTDRIHIDSCGTGDWHVGHPPDRRASAEAARRGYELDHLRARQVRPADFSEFDYILAMDSANFENVRRKDQTMEFSEKLIMMREFDEIDKGADVPDPYFGGEGGFQDVFDILDRSTDQLLDHIIKSHGLEGQ